MPDHAKAWHWPDFAALRRGHHVAAAEQAPAEPDEAPKQDAAPAPAPRKPKAEAADSAASSPE
jgi:hypothetical protein